MNNGQPIGLGLDGKLTADPGIPVLTPEAAVARRIQEEEKRLNALGAAFDADLQAVLRKHKPTNYCCIFSFAGEVEGTDPDFKIPKRSTGTTFIGDQATNLGIAQVIVQVARNKVGLV